MAFRIIPHPRIHNKPLKCKAGLHGNNWETVLIRGIPHLVCKKCGAMISKAVHEGQISETDHRKLTNVGKYKPQTTEEMVKEIWEKRQQNPRR